MEYPWEIYSLKELLQATNNFNDSNKLGEGGFGTVYWGRTSKGVEVHARSVHGVVNLHVVVILVCCRRRPARASRSRVSIN
jgi:hypothetical protein